MSSSKIYRRNHAGLLRNISKSVINSADNIVDLLEDTLKVIGDSLNTSLGAIYEFSKPNGFRYVCSYKLEGLNEAECLIQLVKNHAEDCLQYQKIILSNIEGSRLLYFLPLMTDKAYGILVLGFDIEIDAFEMELLESIRDILSSSVERFFLQQQISRQYLSTVKSLVVAIEAKDVYTQGHSQRVADYSQIIGKHLKLREEEIKELGVTGLVHDIGKIGISDQLLTKPDKLTADEFDTIRQHPEIGSKILQPLNVSENIMLGTLLHHKRFDLKGYPLKADIDELPLVPAIIGVADSFDAMTSERSYKKTISKQNAVIELKKSRGTQFHPLIVDVIEELISRNKL